MLDYVKQLYSLQGNVFKGAFAEFSEFLKLIRLGETSPTYSFLTFSGHLAHQNLQSLYIRRRIDSSSMNQKRISGWSWYLHTQYIFLNLCSEVMGDLYC